MVVEGDDKDRNENKTPPRRSRKPAHRTNFRSSTTRARRRLHNSFESTEVEVMNTDESGNQDEDELVPPPAPKKKVIKKNITPSSSVIRQLKFDEYCENSEVQRISNIKKRKLDTSGCCTSHCTHDGISVTSAHPSTSSLKKESPNSNIKSTPNSSNSNSLSNRFSSLYQDESACLQTDMHFSPYDYFQPTNNESIIETPTHSGETRTKRTTQVSEKTPSDKNCRSSNLEHINNFNAGNTNNGNDKNHRGNDSSKKLQNESITNKAIDDDMSEHSEIVTVSVCQTPNCTSIFEALTPSSENTSSADLNAGKISTVFDTVSESDSFEQDPNNNVREKISSHINLETPISSEESFSETPEDDSSQYFEQDSCLISSNKISSSEEDSFPDY